ncbi:hypothetical protein KY289_027649 [Solanum tuberosum]|nr:hypothetical protein KY289_027649 [Solanum tuberosum]
MSDELQQHGNSQNIPVVPSKLPEFLESALTCMLEARHVPVDALGKDNPKICDKYWSQLQMLLKKMLSVSLCPTKSSANSQHTCKSADAGKLKELYKMSLKYTDFSQLQVDRLVNTSDVLTVPHKAVKTASIVKQY